MASALKQLREATFHKESIQAVSCPIRIQSEAWGLNILKFKTLLSQYEDRRGELRPALLSSTLVPWDRAGQKRLQRREADFS